MREEKYLKLLDDNKLIELRALLERAIKDNLVIKTNGRARVNAIKRILKSKLVKERPVLQGCGVFDDKFVFTDLYQMAVINDNLGYAVKENFPDIKYVCDRFMQSATMLYVDLKDLLYCYKVKKNYKSVYFNSISFDYNHLKNAIDIMGENTKVYTNDAKNVLIFKNNNDELFIIMGRREQEND